MLMQETKMKFLILFFLIPFTIYSQIVMSTNVYTSATGGGAYHTDSLKYYWDDNNLTAGTVTANEWEDELNNSPFTNVDSDPEMVADSGVVFDGNDDIFRAFTFPIVNGVSLELVIFTPDSATTNGCWATINNSSIDLNLYNDTGDDRVYVSAYNGTTYYLRWAFSTPIHNQYIHIVAVWDTSTAPKLYINGSLKTVYTVIDNGDSGQTSRVLLGYGRGGSLSNGNKIRLFRVYTKELSSDNVTTNYNSTSVQNKLP